MNFGSEDPKRVWKDIIHIRSFNEVLNECISDPKMEWKDVTRIRSSHVDVDGCSSDPKIRRSRGRRRIGSDDPKKF